MALPTSVRVPFFSVKIDPSQASQGPAILNYKALMIGGRTTVGTVAELILKRVANENEARLWWGEGSEMHLMSRAWFANNRFVPLYGIALDDAGGAVKATKTLTVSFVSDGASIEEVASFAVYIGGKRIPVTVAVGDDEDDIAQAIYDAIADEEDLPVTSVSPGAAIVTLTARNGGAAGNDIDVRLNYGEGEELPDGVAIAIANGVTGANNPDLQDVIDILGDDWYQVIFAPYSDPTNLAVIETELESRFDEVRQIPGQYIAAHKETVFSTLETFGHSRNSQHVRMIDAFGVPWTSFELAAAWASLEAASAQNNPSKPQFRQKISGVGAKQPALVDQRSFLEQNSLLHAGISIVGYGPGGTIQIGRAITMYQLNEAGGSDDSFLRAETMYTLTYLRYSHRNLFLSKYARAKLADDGAFVPPGDQFLTPSEAKSETMALARQWELLGLVENLDQFKNDLVVERDVSDPDRLNFNLRPDMVNQFVVGAANIQFKL